MIEKLSADKFKELVKEFNNLCFYQSANWAKLKAYTGWKALFLAYKENNAYKACGLFLLKKMPLLKAYLAYCPRGYLTDFENLDLLERFNNELIPFLKQEHIFELIIDPYLPLNKRDINGQIIPDTFDHQNVVDKLKDFGYRHTGYNLHFENLQPRFLFRLNIAEKNYDELLNSFKKEAKRRALKKELYGISLRELKEDEIPTFKKLMSVTSQRKEFVDRSLGYYQQMYSALHDDGILRYLIAEIDTQKCRANINKEIDKIVSKINKLKEHENSNAGKIKEENVTLNSYQKILEQVDKCEKENGSKAALSCACLLTYGEEAIMLLAGNDDAYLQHFNTSNIIVAEMIKLAKEEGYTYYNFYGISGDFDPKSPSYGLYSYKKQYGGEVVELIGQFEYTINSFIKHIYDIMLKAYKLLKK